MSIYVYSATSRTYPVLIDGVIVQATYYNYTHNQSLEEDANWFGSKSNSMFARIKYWAERGLNKAIQNNTKYLLVGDDGDAPDGNKTLYYVDDVKFLEDFIWDYEPNKKHILLGEFNISKIGRKNVFVKIKG